MFLGSLNPAEINRTPNQQIRLGRYKAGILGFFRNLRSFTTKWTCRQNLISPAWCMILRTSVICIDRVLSQPPICKCQEVFQTPPRRGYSTSGMEHCQSRHQSLSLPTFPRLLTHHSSVWLLLQGPLKGLDLQEEKWSLFCHYFQLCRHRPVFPVSLALSVLLWTGQTTLIKWTSAQSKQSWFPSYASEYPVWPKSCRKISFFCFCMYKSKDNNTYLMKL